MNKPNNFLECPFCGGQADASMPAGGKLAWVRCSNDKCFLSSIKYQHPTDWNTRMTQLNKYEPMTDKQRVAFEREYARRYGGGQFKQNRNDTYANYIVQEKWEMWQAALSQQPSVSNDMLIGKIARITHGAFFDEHAKGWEEEHAIEMQRKGIEMAKQILAIIRQQPVGDLLAFVECSLAADLPYKKGEAVFKKHGYDESTGEPALLWLRNRGKDILARFNISDRGK